MICKKYHNIFHLMEDPYRIGEATISLKPCTSSNYSKRYRFLHAQKQQKKNKLTRYCCRKQPFTLVHTRFDST